MKIKKSILTGCLTTALLFGSNISLAKVPNDASLLKLVKIVNAEQNIQEGMKFGFINSFTQNNLNNPMFRSLSEDKQAQLEALTQEFAEKVWAEVDTSALPQQVVDNYLLIAKKYYNQEEVDALIKFYDTPLGQSIVAKEVHIASQLLNNVMADFLNDKELIQLIEQGVIRNSAEFESRLQEILQQ